MIKNTISFIFPAVNIKPFPEKTFFPASNYTAIKIIENITAR